ncbi:mitochondrial distribution and morphology protein 12 [Striga asiatica]|uniref:Mitochondrial distribution and morphology protein 12 n=1 Tax=Striga asiatica TaxID=4170 RepID=A0A5A7QLM4_STRAF|nr:mitochondrial distribution and morphology protein 12 [Striga asiatica]
MTAHWRGEVVDSHRAAAITIREAAPVRFFLYTAAGPNSSGGSVRVLAAGSGLPGETRGCCYLSARETSRADHVATCEKNSRHKVDVDGAAREGFTILRIFYCDLLAGEAHVRHVYGDETSQRFGAEDDPTEPTARRKEQVSGGGLTKEVRRESPLGVVHGRPECATEAELLWRELREWLWRVASASSWLRVLPAVAAVVQRRQGQRRREE